MATVDFVSHFVFVELSDLLYDFLPGSGNANHAFPIAANEVGVIQHWQGGSKKPAILHLLKNTYSADRKSFCPLILAIIQHSVPWRQNRGSPLTSDEVIKLNKILLKLEIKIPELHRHEFLSGLAEKDPTTVQTSPPDAFDHGTLAKLCGELLAMNSIAPVPRGFAFERFLNEVFAAYKLNPRKSFRLQGEQIDGSFELDSHTYLVEAKWQNELIGSSLLRAFSGTVTSKSIWSRGLYISYTGFSSDGLAAFGRGQSTPIICMDGFDLSLVLQGQKPLTDVIRAKARRAAETGNPFVRVGEL